MAATNKWACLPILLLVSLISLASARIFTLDSDDHSSFSTAYPHSDDPVPINGVKRKLPVSPSQLEHTDDHSSISIMTASTPIQNHPSDRDWLFEKGQMVMSTEDDGTKNVVEGGGNDKYSSLRPPTDEDWDDLMTALKGARIDNTDGAFADAKCGSVLCSWGSHWGWGWNQGGGSNYQWGYGGGGNGGYGGGGGSSGYGGGGGGYGGGGGGGYGGGGGGGGGYGGGGGGGYGGGGGGGGYGGGGGGGGYGGGGGGGGYGGGGGGYGGGRGGGYGGSVRGSWSWSWGGGGGGKLAASKVLGPNKAASEMTIDAASAPMPVDKQDTIAINTP